MRFDTPLLLLMLLGTAICVLLYKEWGWKGVIFALTGTLSGVAALFVKGEKKLPEPIPEPPPSPDEPVDDVAGVANEIVSSEAEKETAKITEAAKTAKGLAEKIRGME